MKKIITVLIIAVVLFGGLYLIQKNSDIPTDAEQDGTIDDNQYEDISVRFFGEDHDFSILYPAQTWENFVEQDELAPKYNLYFVADENYGEILPFDHFANQTHVSIFPEGIPTEGLMVQTININDTNIDFPYELSDDSEVFVLEDGTPFAAYLKPVNQPESWNSSGFIWLRLEVNNLSTTCLRGGEEVSQQECDPLTRGDEITWSGDVDSERWSQLINIAESFQFETTLEENSNDENIPESAQNESIRVANPVPGSVVESPLELRGEVRGTWLFEATSQVILTDWDGRIIAESYIEAEEDWMTEDFVPFSGELQFEEPEDIGDFSDFGSIIFQKANPSGLPENDDALEFRVRFRE